MSNKDEKIEDIIKIFEKIKEKLENFDEKPNLDQLEEDLEKDLKELKDSLDDLK